MKLFSPIDYQRQLIVASLDDFSPNGTLPNYCGGQDGLHDGVWRQAVIEFLCINTKLGFIEATHKKDICSSYDTKKLEILLISGGEVGGMDLSTVWNALYFNGTDNLISIVKKFNLHNWDSAISTNECGGFISFIKNSYGII